MAQKADVIPTLSKFNRENAKPHGQRPHDMSAEDVHDMFFYRTPFHDDNLVQE